MAFFPQKRTNFFERLFKRTNKQEQMNLDAENLPSSEQQEWIKHLCDNLQVGIWIKGSIDRKITFASKGLEDILEIPLKTFYKNPDIWKEMVLPMYRKELFKKYKLLKKGQSIEHYYRIRVSSGEVKWVYEQTIPQINEQGEVTHLFGMVSDVSAEMEMKKKLEYISKNDSLTSLPNQRSLDQKLDELVEDNHTSAFALLYIDLDNFSWVNDHLGFKIGDLVLLQTANRLMSMVPEDGFLARVNSNEFILIVRNYEHKDAVFQLAGEVIKRVSKQLNVEGYELHITTSIGISFFPENGDHKLIIMENAHTALFHAKNLGKNNYQFYSFDKDINSHKKYMLEQDLRKAIQNEEFELYYQPQVNPNSGAIEGSEALIRWNHHDWGIVSPGEFIPLAEEKHLIHEIGDWVIENVCSQLKV